MAEALVRSSIRLTSFNTSNKHLRLFIADLKNIKSHAEGFYKAQDEAMRRLFKWSVEEKNQILTETCKYLEEIYAHWTEIQKDFVNNFEKLVLNQFTCILKDETELHKLKKSLDDLEKEEEKLKRKLMKPNGALHVRNAAKIKVAELAEEIASTSNILNIKSSFAMMTKEKRIRDGLNLYGENFLHAANKGRFVFETFYKATRCLPDPSNPLSSDQMVFNLEQTRNSVVKTKAQIARYNKLKFPNEIILNENDLPRYESPPPYSPSSMSFSQTPSSSVGFHQYDQVTDNMIRNLNISFHTSPAGRYENMASTSVSQQDEEGAVGGRI